MGQSDQNKVDQSEITLNNVRLNHVHISEPISLSFGGHLIYTSQVLIPKSDIAMVENVKAAIAAAYTKGVNGKWNAAAALQTHKYPLRDGDLREDKGKNAELDGHWYIFARTLKENPPVLMDSDNNAITDEGKFYSGCYANVTINIYPFSIMGINGVSCQLKSVQFVHDGETI